MVQLAWLIEFCMFPFWCQWSALVCVYKINDSIITLTDGYAITDHLIEKRIWSFT